MAEPLLLAIDAGTGSCRAVLFDEYGRQLAISQREYVHPAIEGIPGSQAFDTATNWGLIADCVREVVGRAEGAPIAAVSATSMREGIVLYDARGKEIWACPNVDSRAGHEVEELVESGEARQIYERAGDWVAITSPARLRWIARHEPDVFAAVAHLGMLGDWILTRLSGEFITDPSLGSSSGMFDLATADWSEQVIELTGLPRSVFPPVVASGTVIGSVTAEAGVATGLPAGTPVVAGGADTQLALLGLGDTEPGRFTVVGGSFWQETMLVDEPLMDPQARLRTLCHAIPDRWMIEGIGFYCGMVMRWFRDAFCAAETRVARLHGEDAYTALEHAAAELPPGADGVTGIFSNLMQADRWVHASPAFVGFDLSAPPERARPQCFRAIEESAAYVARGHLEIVEEVTGREVDEVVMTAGASQGLLWPQVLADVLGRPVRVPVVKESAAVGAAICAGVGVGIYADPGEVARTGLEFESTFHPQPEAVDAYEALYENWGELYRRSLEIADAGLARPLWRAAGT